MAVTINTDGITFGDATSQNTAAGAPVTLFTQVAQYLSPATFTASPTTSSSWAVAVGGGGGGVLAVTQVRGGAGGLAAGNVSLTGGSNYTVNVGGGGGGATFGTGGTGGVSAFDNFLTGNGGTGASASPPDTASYNNGTPGSGTGPALAYSSTSGAHGVAARLALFSTNSTDIATYVPAVNRNDRGNGGAPSPGNNNAPRSGIGGIVTVLYDG
jgi:hypothetical protein